MDSSGGWARFLGLLFRPTTTSSASWTILDLSSSPFLLFATPPSPPPSPDLGAFKSTAAAPSLRVFFATSTCRVVASRMMVRHPMASRDPTEIACLVVFGSSSLFLFGHRFCQHIFGVPTSVCHSSSISLFLTECLAFRFFFYIACLPFWNVWSSLFSVVCGLSVFWDLG